jgi:hypothetical protein
MYNLYSYMFRHFHVVIREYYICVSLSYTSFPNLQLLELFHKIKMFRIKLHKVLDYGFIKLLKYFVVLQ